MQATGNLTEISLYIHVPFCSHKCPYCHFYVIPNKAADQRLFLEALQLELEKRKSQLQGKKLISLYFGGGTPSLLAPHALQHILSWIKSSGIIYESSCEITLEANPEHLHLSLLKEFYALGINRISLGVQSLDDSSLSILERGHSSQKAIEAIYSCADAGIRNISIDLMYDLPSQTLESFERTLGYIHKLPITHLSLYNLTIEPHTSFFKKKKSLAPLLPSQESSLAMLQMAVDYVQNANFKRYEISAFAKPSYESKHNMGYWTARPFLGFGPSAFSYWDKKRFSNSAHLKRYAEKLNQGLFPVDFEEELSQERKVAELLAVQLRLLAGVNVDAFTKMHGPFPDELQAAIRNLIQEELLDWAGTTLKLTEQGLLFYDSVGTALVLT